MKRGNKKKSGQADNKHRNKYRTTKKNYKENLSIKIS